MHGRVQGKGFIHSNFSRSRAGVLVFSGGGGHDGSKCKGKYSPIQSESAPNPTSVVGLGRHEQRR